MNRGSWTDTISTQNCRTGTIRTGWRGLAEDLAAIWRILEEWGERSRQRRMLASLDPEILKDIGISEADAWVEASKPWWRR